MRTNLCLEPRFVARRGYTPFAEAKFSPHFPKRIKVNLSDPAKSATSTPLSSFQKMAIREGLEPSAC